MPLTPAERNARIIELHPVVMQVARRVARRMPGADVEELAAAGALGLIDAVDRYDPTLGVPLPAYAAIRVRGAILDAIRSDDWAPRRLRSSGTRLGRTRAELEGRLGRAAGHEEVAEAMGVDRAEYERIRDDTSRRVVALDADPEQPIQVPLDQPDAFEACLAGEQEQLVRRALQRLDQRDARVIRMISLEDRSLKETGAALGVSESRACQLHTRAVARLRHSLAALRR